jgi:hypothetical protein
MAVRQDVKSKDSLEVVQRLESSTNLALYRDLCIFGSQYIKALLLGNYYLQ